MSMKMVCVVCGLEFEMLSIPIMDGEQPCIQCARCGSVYGRDKDDEEK